MMNTDMHTETPSGPRSDWRATPVSRMPKGVPDGGRVGGVVAGVSRAYGFDLRTTRIAVAIATIVVPALAIVYLVAWLLLPATPEQAVPLDRVFRDRRRLPLLAVVGLVVVVGAVGSFGSWFFFHGAPWGLVLIAFGVLLWVATGDREPRSVPPAPPAARPAAPSSTPAGAAAAATSVPVPGSAPTGPVPQVADDGAGFPPPSPADRARITAELPITSSAGTMITSDLPVVTVHAPSQPQRPRRPIGSIGTGVAVLWVALAALGEAAGWWSIATLWVVVAALGIVMTALFVSSVVNRSWVLPFAFVAVGALLVALSVARPNLDGGTGDRTVRPTTVAEATTTSHLAVGQLTVDLRQVPITGTLDVTAEVGMGRLHVVVPRDVDLRVLTDMGMGEVELDSTEISSGTRHADTTDALALDPPARGTLVLHLTVGMGQIDVERLGG